VTILRRAVDRVLEMPVVYAAWQRPVRDAKVRPFLARVDLKTVGKVLDVGCGPGTNAPVFRGTDYVGVDINPAYIATARQRHAGRFVVADVSDPAAFPEERFDCIFVNSLLHHLDDATVTQLLQRLAGLTTADGRIHILDLILPPAASAARTLALADRGRFPRPREAWDALFASVLRVEHSAPYDVGLPSLPLWRMLYVVGAAR
jgi:SAM-dependent methyltransferase